MVVNLAVLAKVGRGGSSHSDDGAMSVGYPHDKEETF
jgi:hypothetical protein